MTYWKNVQGLLTLTAQRGACETWNTHPLYWGSVPLESNFTGTGSSPAKILIPFDRLFWFAAAVPLEVIRQRNFIAVLFALTERVFFAILRFRSNVAKCVQLCCFHRRSTSLQSNFTWTGSFPINYFSQQKARDTRLLEDANRIPLRSLVLTISECDGQTDGRKDGRICCSIMAYSACEASFAVRCKNWRAMFLEQRV